MNQSSDQKIRMFALTSNGRRLSFSIPVKKDLDLVEESHAVLSKKGFPDDELKNLVLSPTEPEELPPAEVKIDRVRALSENKVNDWEVIPDPPKSMHKNQFPDINKKYNAIKVSTSKDINIFICCGKKNTYLPLSAKLGVLKVCDLDPPFPTPYKIALTRYWKLNFYHGFESRISFVKSITINEGMSKTDLETFSSELWIAWNGLSTKLSKSFSTSCTVSEEKSITDSYQAKLNQGETGAFTLWQLIEEYVVVDQDNKPIEWEGTVKTDIGIPLFKKQGPYYGVLQQTYFPVKTPIYNAMIWELDA